MGNPVALIYNLGCRVNSCESASVACALRARGFTVVEHGAEKDSDAVADIIVVNTCAVTAESAAKSRRLIRRTALHNPGAAVIVAGCYAQSGADDVMALPGVVYVCGNDGKSDIPRIACELVEARRAGREISAEYAVTDISLVRRFESARSAVNTRTRAFVKIEDGCDSRCSYCIVPLVRGHVRSNPEDEVLGEIREQLDAGVREVVLTGIETGAYGRDLDGVSLAGLLEKADKLDGLYLLRLGSLDPAVLTEEFVGRVARLSHFERHFHLSVQSGSGEVLAAMRRKYNAERLKNGIALLRREIPGVQLSADVIVGFPGETDAQFEETLALVRDERFFHSHIFPFSVRAGTDAALMDGKLPHGVIKERAARLEEQNAENKRLIYESLCGTEDTVLFETPHGGFQTGYTRSFIPVKMRGGASLRGTVVPVVIGKNGMCEPVLP